MEIQAPNRYDMFADKAKVFLGGSIEMGKAADWQQAVVSAIKDLDVVILNPRRKDWDSSLKQELTDPRFVEQVTWELQALEDSDIIVIYFDPTTKSPISLLELGLHARQKGILVCCPEGFYRKGNVDITCQKYNVPVFPDLNALVRTLRNVLVAIMAAKMEAQPHATLQTTLVQTFDDSDAPDLDDIQPQGQI